MCLTRNISDAAPTRGDQPLDVQQRETTPMAVAMRFFISLYLSRDVKERLWVDLMGM